MATVEQKMARSSRVTERYRNDEAFRERQLESKRKWRRAHGIKERTKLPDEVVQQHIWEHRHQPEVMEQVRIKQRERYRNDPAYRESCKRRALARYYRKKQERK